MSREIAGGRRQFLVAALAAAGSAAVRAPDASEASADSLWDGFDGRITERTLAEAEKLFAVSFTGEERRLMLGGGAVEESNGRFEQQRNLLEQWREIEKPNALAPATVFDPRLPGVAYPVQQDKLETFVEPLPALPSDARSVAFAPVKHQMHWLATGQLSSLELTDIYLARIEAHAPRLACFVTVTPEIARRQAMRADRERAAGSLRGPLHGIAYGMKDLADTAGVRTTWGAAPYQHRVPAKNAAVVARLESAGAVMLGKTTLGALAWGDVWFDGITRNPWNTSEGSSGSSAGSCSAAAAGLCSFAVGTETWGSIVSPSERCGTAGLRPTHGRVSRAGAMALCWSLDKIGAVGRYAEDTAVVLSVLNGYDAEDPGSLQHGLVYDGNQSLAGMTVGYDPALFDRETVRGPDLAALEALRATGVRLVEVKTPDLPWQIMNPLLGAEAAAAFEALTLSNRDDELRRQIANAWPNVLRASRFFSAVDYVQCDRMRRSIMQELHNFFGQADAMFGPSHGHSLTALTNLSGHPVIAFRAGFESVRSRPLEGQPASAMGKELHRIPRTVRLWGSLFQEGKLVAIARAVESALGAADERPPSF